MDKSTILLVDDDTSILRSFSADFREICPAVTTVASAEEAIAALDDDFFDIVITDLVMPGASGLQVLLEAKKRDSAPASSFSPVTAVSIPPSRPSASAPTTTCSNPSIPRRCCCVWRSICKNSAGGASSSCGKKC